MLPTQHSLARSLGKAACLYGYPLVEMLRTCMLQTTSRFDPTRAARAAIDTLHHSAHPPIDRGPERAATGATRLYTTAWIYLGDGPRILRLPRGRIASGQRLQASLYDAHGEAVFSFGAGEADAADIELLLTGPHTDAALDLAGRTAVGACSDLVWLIASIETHGDPEGAHALTARIDLDAPADTLQHRRPPAVDLWEGDASDAMVDWLQRNESASTLAPMYYGNLCRALAQVRARPQDREQVAGFRQVGLAPGASLDWRQLLPAVQQGLIEGFEEAAWSLGTRASDDNGYFASARNASLMPSLTPMSFGNAFSDAAASLSL